jgi:hypothetical protein
MMSSNAKAVIARCQQAQGLAGYLMEDGEHDLHQSKGRGSKESASPVSHS